MIILYTSLIFSCVWLGVLQAKKLSTREMFYENLLGFLRAFNSNLSFVQKGYMELVDEYLESGVGAEFEAFLSGINSGEKHNLEFLSAREIKDVENIVLSLGKNDEETERRLVEDAIKVVSEKKERATKNCMKYSSFSIKLSLLVGALLVILLL